VAAGRTRGLAGRALTGTDAVWRPALSTMGTMTGEPARKRPSGRVSDDVARRLRQRVSEGEYAVGEKLPAEQELAAEFGVGRSSMREAVRTLQAAGYLRSTHGVGVFVVNQRPRPITLDQSLLGGYTMSDLFEARIAIESSASALAARRLTDHHRELLESIIASASDPNISNADFVKLDARLHRQVAEASGNPLLLHMWESLASQFEEYSTKVIGMPGRLEKAHHDHVGIVEAIILGNSERAAERARDHVLAVQRELQ
jgi:GntR family transcriptional repressor for pyruvate dehydrogenase complex